MAVTTDPNPTDCQDYRFCVVIDEWGTVRLRSRHPSSELA